METIRDRYRPTPRAGESRALPAAARIVVGGELLSSIGTGTTVPFLLVYLRNVCNSPVGAIGLLLVVRAVVALGGAVLGGTLCDQVGPKAVVVTALAAAAVCSLGMAAATSPLAGGVALLAHTAAFTVLAPALNAMLAQAAPGPARQAAFAWRSTAINLGGALGAATASATLFLLGTATGLPMLYAVDAVSFVGFALLVAVRVAPSPRQDSHRAELAETRTARSGGGYVATLADPVLRRICFVVAFAAAGAMLKTCGSASGRDAKGVPSRVID
ncbi:MFS transporter [Streptomyces sp. NPDC005244]|uniref:MFS transporter n=1 Tax=Streptomyces sp. NPDC005244 TaxID=3364708 RepID=UPI0036B42ABD